VRSGGCNQEACRFYGGHISRVALHKSDHAATDCTAFAAFAPLEIFAAASKSMACSLPAAQLELRDVLAHIRCGSQREAFGRDTGLRINS
jgi:hypothetical protein